jgi:hypothetical protein
MSAPSHPFGGADAQGEGREDHKPKGEVEKIQHWVTPDDDARRLRRSRVRRPFGNRSERVNAA